MGEVSLGSAICMWSCFGCGINENDAIRSY